jgi:hypothetical protein
MYGENGPARLGMICSVANNEHPWQNVSQFLETNECSNLTPAFLQKGVDGTELLLNNN